MNKSTYTMEHFDHQRQMLCIGHGLETVGETRFGTMYWCGQAVLRELLAFKVIANDEALQIRIPVSCNSLQVVIENMAKCGNAGIWPPH